MTLQTWKPRIASAASPRSESKSAKRGWPGGGATAGEGASDCTAVAAISRCRASTRRAAISSSSNDRSQSRLQFTSLPRARASKSPTSAAARRSPAASASRLGSTAIRLGEMAAIASGVLFSKLFVTVSMPAAAISIGTRLGCGVYISARPTSWSRRRFA